MGKGPTQERTLESILLDRGVSEKDIGWVLSKLDSQEYILDDCHYMARILSKESENNAKEIFINNYFTLNMKGVSNENKLNDAKSLLLKTFTISSEKTLKQKLIINT